MGNYKHGAFLRGFMLCDRCIWNGECKDFEAGGQCGLERASFERVVSELMDEFELDSVADKILVERAAMYLVRVARAEAYDASVGLSERSPVWGYYISKLDNTMRGLLGDLAVTRAKRKQLEKNEALLVSVDDVLRKFERAEVQARNVKNGKRRLRKVNLKRKTSLLAEWEKATAEFRESSASDGACC